MQIDLFLELATPPGSGRDAGDAIEDGIALARAADRAGFGAVWLAEHHFVGDYSAAAAPELVLAAIARETRRIGLGFAVVPLPLHAPVRVAERFATLDRLSGGRVLWGVGRGVTATELAAFGVAPADSRGLFLERLEALRTMLATGVMERDGARYELHPAPRPQLATGWMAAVSPESFELAAKLGLEVMSGPFKPWPLVRADLARYRRLRPEGRTAFALAAYCEADGAAARRRAEAGIVWVYRRIREIAAAFLERRTEGYEHYRHLGRLAPLLDPVLGLRSLELLGLAAVGDADHVGRRLAVLARSGLDRALLSIGGGDLDRAHAEACITRIGAEVLPRIAAGRPARAARA